MSRRAIVLIAAVTSMASCAHYDSGDSVQGPRAAIAIAKRVCAIDQPQLAAKRSDWTATRDGDTWTVCTFEIYRGEKFCQGAEITISKRDGKAGKCSWVITTN